MHDLLLLVLSQLSQWHFMMNAISARILQDTKRQCTETLKLLEPKPNLPQFRRVSILRRTRRRWLGPLSLCWVRVRLQVQLESFDLLQFVFGFGFGAC